MKTGSKGVLGLAMRIGDVIIGGYILNHISIDSASVSSGIACNCGGVFLIHVAICLIALITDYLDTKSYGTHPVLKILGLATGFILTIIAMNLGHLICAGGILITSFIAIVISIATEKE